MIPHAAALECSYIEPAKSNVSLQTAVKKNGALPRINPHLDWAVFLVKPSVAEYVYRVRTMETVFRGLKVIL